MNRPSQNLDTLTASHTGTNTAHSAQVVHRWRAQAKPTADRASRTTNNSTEGIAVASRPRPSSSAPGSRPAGTERSGAPSACSCARQRSRATSTSCGLRSMASTCAPRRASSMAKLPVPQPASSTRWPRRSVGSQASSVSRMRSRPARTVARTRLTGAVLVRRAQVSAAVRSK